VLVPNTIATVLAVGVFDIGAADLWWFATLILTSTVASTWLAWWFVRRKGWLPSRVE
jgi:hypothetical protein